MMMVVINTQRVIKKKKKLAVSSLYTMFLLIVGEITTHTEVVIQNHTKSESDRQFQAAVTS